MFLHEFAHFRRGDIILHLITVALQILHWFNPVLWIAFSRMRHDRELAADALVLSGPRAPLKTLYGHTLLKLIEGSSPGLPVPRLVGIMENAKEIEERILWIKRAAPAARRQTALGAALLLFVGAAALTQGTPRPSSLPIESKDSTTTPVEDQLEAVAIFDRTKKKYSACQTFSCTGIERKTRDSLAAKTDNRSFLIRFERPNRIRIDWDESWFPVIGTGSSSIYMEEGRVLSYSSFLRKTESYASIGDAIGIQAGVSEGISYFIPSLLLGQLGYLDHWSLTRGQDSTVEGVDCYSISVETKGFGIYTLYISKADFSIRQALVDSQASVLNAQRERARKENPAWFNDPPGTPKVTLSSQSVIEFHDLKFGEPIRPEAFKAPKP